MMDLGRGGVVRLPAAETQRRWDATTPQWPIMHAVTYGVSRDQMMARHKANHIQVAYAEQRLGSGQGDARQGRDGRCARHAGRHLRDQEERQVVVVIELCIVNQRGRPTEADCAGLPPAAGVQ